MSQAHDTKPCSFAGCDGVMTFSPHAMPPSEQTGLAEAAPSSREPPPPWVCDRSRAHFEPVWSSAESVPPHRPARRI
jgi:hypothetical protein